jgi:hypothetical protein
VDQVLEELSETLMEDDGWLEMDVMEYWTGELERLGQLPSVRPDKNGFVHLVSFAARLRKVLK